MLKNAPTLAIVAVHTEENEPPEVWKHKNHYFIRVLVKNAGAVDAASTELVSNRPAEHGAASEMEGAAASAPARPHFFSVLSEARSLLYGQLR